MKLAEIVSRDPEIVSGTLCFTGTRVPAQSLIDHLKAGDTLEDFLEGFPSVNRTQAEEFLEYAHDAAAVELAHLRVLPDEQLDHRIRYDFGESIEAVTVQFQGWQGTKNGELLRLAAREFDALVSMDKGIEHQQDWQTCDLIIIILSAKTNRYADVKPLVPLAEKALFASRPRQLIHVP